MPKLHRDEFGEFCTPRRWGGRYLLTNDPALLNARNPFARRRVTVVDTGDLSYPRPIDLQVRFAENNSQNQPVIEVSGNGFFPQYPQFFPLGSVRTRFVVRRGLDRTSTVIGDEFYLSQYPQQFPRDIIVARALGVDVEIVEDAPVFSVWVDVVAAPVHTIGHKNSVPGWNTNTTFLPTIAGNHVAAVASPGSVLLLEDNPARAQFFLVNTSTNANMWIGFGAPPIVGVPGVGRAAMILPPSAFNTYESPVGGYTGDVWASWDDAAPTGGALVTEGNY